MSEFDWNAALARDTAHPQVSLDPCMLLMEMCDEVPLARNVLLGSEWILVPAEEYNRQTSVICQFKERRRAKGTLLVAWQVDEALDTDV